MANNTPNSNHLSAVSETSAQTDEALSTLPPLLSYYVRFEAAHNYAAVSLRREYVALCRQYSTTDPASIAEHILSELIKLDNVNALIKRDVENTIRHCHRRAPKPFNLFSLTQSRVI